MGELARRPGCPEPAETPLALLTPRPGEGFTFFDRHTLPALGLACGVLIATMGNIVRKRPYWAGIHMHVAAGGLGWLLATMFQRSKFAARAERDAVFKHYITLHPEDFPPFERKRYAEIYYPFKPIR